tara:strand:+ start:53 stop:175 length:123 start_codon:yes stop_codon:yes gene_type:complete
MPNKAAKMRKRKKRILNDWLKSNRRTAKQYKKKQLKKKGE